MIRKLWTILFAEKKHPEKQQEKLTKHQYFEKWEIAKLIADLHEAAKLLSKFCEGKPEDFLYLLNCEIDDLEHANRIDLTPFYIWFAPTSEWDDFMGMEGVELGERIFEKVSKWKDAYDKGIDFSS